MSKTDNPTLSERLRSTMRAGYSLYALAPEILQALDDSESFVPDAAHINALPEPLSRYIHDLATKCDPAGDIQTIWSQRAHLDGLSAQVEQLESDNAHYRATIVQLERERKEAIDRCAELEKYRVDP